MTTRIGRQSRVEFIALQAAIIAILAVATDMMLPAFGAISDHFALASSSDVALVVTIYFIGLASGQYVYGPLADRFGRKPVLLLGIGIYAVSALSSALAPTFTWMLVSRLIWGLGAAAPRTVSQAIIRDRFDGDEMTRVMSFTFAVFMISPTVGPLIGQTVLEIGSWRWTFVMGFVIAVCVALWSIFRLDESLPAERRRPLNPQAVIEATAETFRNRMARGNMLAFAATMVMLVAYLGAIQPMFDRIYGEADRFPLWFALGAISSAAAALTAARLVKTLGTRTVAIRGLAVYLGVCCIFLIGSVQAGGRPPFPFFLVMVTLLIAAHSGAAPMLNSLAMQQVAHIAGTAAATIGTVSFLSASILASVVTRFIDESVTPFAAGFVVFVAIAIVIAVQTNRPSPVDDVSVRSADPAEG